MKLLTSVAAVTYALVVLPVSVYAASLSNATQTHTTKLPKANLLFVVTAKHGTIEQIPQKPGRYRLVLQGVRPATTYFGDRPARVAGKMQTKRLVAQWDHGKTFNKMPPNAELSAQSAQAPSKHLAYTVELSHPVYNFVDHRLTFDVQDLPGGTPLPKHQQSEHVSVYVDHWCPSCAI